MKINDSTAHICVNNDEVRPGDGIVLFRNVCETGELKHYGIKHSRTYCQKKEIGRGIITQLLNDHYAVAEFSPAIAFKEGDMVEKR